MKALESGPTDDRSGIPGRRKINLRCQCSFITKNAASSAPSTRRSVQFVAALYIHMMWLAIRMVFSRNQFSSTIRSTLLPLLHH